VSSVAQPAISTPRVGATTAPADADTLTVRLAVFAAFATYAAYHWTNLVEAPSVLLTVAIAGSAIACAVCLIAIDRSVPRRREALPLAAFVVLATLAFALVAIGVAPRLLLPTGWDELATTLDSALVGVQGVDWPYDGPDEWIRRTILLGGPLLLVTAAALAFWPASKEARPPLRGSALVLLIATYAIAVTTNSPGRPLLYGGLLLALIAAWLWLPRMARRERAVGAAVVATLALLALPVATALDGEGPWFDYRSWSPFGADAGIAFDWSHQYGPLDWPRQGSTLLTVGSEEPHYWKAETLDGFDGTRWFRTPDAHNDNLGAEFPSDDRALTDSGSWTYGKANAAWSHRIEITIRSLSTDLLIGAGLTYDVDGVSALLSADGTAELLGDPLVRGDSYTVTAYEPDPSPLQMANAPTAYPLWVSRYTEIALPSGSTGSNSLDNDLAAVPPRDSDADPDQRSVADDALSGSAYRRTYELALALTAGSSSAYEAVEAIETHLRDSYAYDERVPESRYPLESFLFEDRRGYCQQFSGAMALMLRMVGIPARVVAGFSPGTLNRKTGEYRVRDLDAHSWVEVYFPGIGWVPFDPTPHAGEAATRPPDTVAGGGFAGDVSQESADPEPVPDTSGDDSDAESDPAGGAVTRGDSRNGGGGPGTAMLLVAAGLGGLGVALTALFTLRLRRSAALDRERLTEAEIAELRDALDRLGWDVSPSTTLLALERQLEAGAGPAASGYARTLRTARFDPLASAPPGLAERRALRAALAAGAGPLGRLRALLAIPPGGPAGWPF
jgi:hypothetical protein